MFIRNVTVFGGALPKPGEPAYIEAMRLGSLLAQSGYAVLTGGYIGTMEAVSRGASEAGGHVIGVTCDEIEAFRSGGANPWVKEERRFATLRERIMALIEGGDAALALPGGPGTLTEISTMWNHLLTGAVSPRLLILIGEGWKATFDAFFNCLGEYTSHQERAWLSFAKNVDEAIKRLNNQREI